AHIIDKLLLARGNDVRAPQQQPGVDQRQSQQQPLQAVCMTDSSQLQAEAPAIVFEIFKHLLDSEPLLVAGTGKLAGRLRGNEIPGLSRGRCPVHGQVEPSDLMVLSKGNMGPEAALTWEQQRHALKERGPGAPHIPMHPQSQTYAPALCECPL